MSKMCSMFILGISLFLVAVRADTVEFMAVEELRPGMKGVGKTVFKGTEVEDFDVEVMGVLKNVRPKSDLILLKLSGGPLEESGLIAGMSGSPVYVEGRLVGALAYAMGVFPKEPIAAAVPIEEMVSPQRSGGLGMGSRRSKEYGDISPIATPIVYSGFDPQTINWLAECLEDFGLVPVAGGGGGEADSAPMVPGSVLSVKLMDGDIDMSAVGTLTYLDGDRFYAWGHPLFLTGKAELPAAGGYVHAIYKSSMASNKIVSPTRAMGAVLEDRLSGVSGRIDARAKMLPLTINVHSGGAISEYHVDVILNELLTPFLCAAAVINSATVSGSRTGEVTINSETNIRLEGHEPIRFKAAYSDSTTISTMAADVRALIGAIMNNGFERVKFDEVEVKLDMEDKRRVAVIADAWVDRLTAASGDTIVVTIGLRPYVEKERKESVRLVIPEDSPAGDVRVTVADGLSESMSAIVSNPFRTHPRNFKEFVETIESVRPANSVVVRMYTPGHSVLTSVGDMPSVPPSFLSVISKSQPQRVTRSPDSACCERVLETPEVIRGSMTLTVRVEER